MPLGWSNLATATAFLAALSCSPVPDSASHQEPPLANTVWILTELAGDSVALPPNLRLADLRFQSGALITGFTGCNVLTGRYEATDSRLEFREPLVTNRRMCPTPATMAQERALLESLRRTTRYEFAGSWLNLYSENELLARFMPGPTGR